jgi:Ca2+-transporting ATPase
VNEEDTIDVAALVLADVGLAMGSGTELAKEARDIIVLDDDFKSIIRAIVWGRAINDNIRCFLTFQLTAIFLGETPFKAVQLQWVNLIMDSFGETSCSRVFLPER